MAVPKTLKPISKEKALSLIAKHEKAGTGSWEGSPMNSDFVYGVFPKLTLIRPFLGKFETGRVSM